MRTNKHAARRFESDKTFDFILAAAVSLFALPFAAFILTVIVMAGAAPALNVLLVSTVSAALTAVVLLAAFIIVALSDNN